MPKWILNSRDINELQAHSLDEAIRKAKHAHMTDIDMRIGGQNIGFEADWLKRLKKHYSWRERLAMWWPNSPLRDALMFWPATFALIGGAIREQLRG